MAKKGPSLFDTPASTQTNEIKVGKRTVPVVPYNEAASILQRCQSSKGYASCMKCSEVVGCETRLTFVAAVHHRMCPTDDGAFEFEG